MELNSSKYDEKSCGIVVFREHEGKRKFLVLHYPSGHWDFAKGHVEEGESEKETATRELLEETGIADIIFIDGFREQISYEFKVRGNLISKEVIFFLAKTDLKDIHLSHEHKGSMWLPYEEAFNRATFDNAKNLLKKANEFLKT